jgi:hypothetical protein
VDRSSLCINGLNAATVPEQLDAVSRTGLHHRQDRPSCVSEFPTKTCARTLTCEAALLEFGTPPYIVEVALPDDVAGQEMM